MTNEQVMRVADIRQRMEDLRDELCEIAPDAGESEDLIEGVLPHLDKAILILEDVA